MRNLFSLCQKNLQRPNFFLLFEKWKKGRFLDGYLSRFLLFPFTTTASYWVRLSQISVIFNWPTFKSTFTCFSFLDSRAFVGEIERSNFLLIIFPGALKMRKCAGAAATRHGQLEIDPKQLENWPGMGNVRRERGGGDRPGENTQMLQHSMPEKTGFYRYLKHVGCPNERYFYCLNSAVISRKNQEGEERRRHGHSNSFLF